MGFPISPIQGLIDWLSGQWDRLMAALDFMALIVRVGLILAGMLPEPDPRVQAIIDDGLAVLDTITKFISLFDYFVNLPVLLTVIAIIFAVEAGLQVVRVWRFVRSLVF